VGLWSQNNAMDQCPASDLRNSVGYEAVSLHGTQSLIIVLITQLLFPILIQKSAFHNLMSYTLTFTSVLFSHLRLTFRSKFDMYYFLVSSIRCVHFYDLFDVCLLSLLSNPEAGCDLSVHYSDRVLLDYTPPHTLRG
jgi:hypothetical protein